MSGQHTPGPWHRNIPPATKYNTVWSGRNTHVAHVKADLAPEEVEANICLIAAAPDLLLTLAEIAAKADLAANACDNEGRASGFRILAADARAAIAKATTPTSGEAQ